MKWPEFYRPVVAKLRDFGHDVLTTLEAGKANQRIPDEEVLRFAVAEERVMLTLTAGILCGSIASILNTLKLLFVLRMLILKL
ncbi:MAG: DUF5615 family PIN-like protein [Saprospiraceae bacterium]|nr:DUF5615 family PIN-like protein [Saprospiraceae bacterium]